MMDYLEKLMDYRLKGYCCSQMLLQLGLDDQKKENKDLINAMKGLCGGLCSGKLCGALSGGACLLSYYDPEKGALELVPQLVGWFEETFESCDCATLLKGNEGRQGEVCENLVVMTYEKVRALLEENA
ncbi:MULTISPECIES: DVU_1555 family C-GCAxxG-C-C protein [Anoxynatronum]|nr:DV_1555 family C-GCAxxG-C-C protein [Anoxynatronum buryatiense]